jgi:hypothetical protein
MGLSKLKVQIHPRAFSLRPKQEITQRQNITDKEETHVYNYKGEKSAMWTNKSRSMSKNTMHLVK